MGKAGREVTFKLLVTGVTYLDGLPFIGTGVDESGRTVNLIFATGHCCSVLDFIEASGVMVQSVHHGGQEALAVNIRRVNDESPKGNRVRLSAGGNERLVDKVQP